ncbi:hypothetical protein CRENBAI_014602 [Crenichthys baileyi]|uniref:Secreted protein n=1 Tax=Crenichthys baileyi TaxID=28760 RepID=A0AAV9SIT7_9TELE
MANARSGSLATILFLFVFPAALHEAQSNQRLIFGQHALLLYLHGNGSTVFTQNSRHTGTEHINYSPPAAYSKITLCRCIYRLIFFFLHYY